jgi:lipopolysaccharide transport system ATP-binding protein
MSVISVEHLSKSFLVGHRSVQRERYTALRDVIGRKTKNFARKAVDLVRGRQIVQGDDIEEFWALKDVSFKVQQGEVLGIIGRNGAGKSTLLKILSRITEPTAGRVKIRGRVASLLEVGTGFHPELSGRENIYLNGSILGMTRREIGQKFDEIVAFAEVERFIDTPVKRFSSGMYVRLAFAVAAHLEPEILIVDEVLAVGDTEFQKKCLGKMHDVSAREGRTVLFVSHNMEAIRSLCSRALVIVNGKTVFSGRPRDAITDYLNDRKPKSEIRFEPKKDRPSITAVSINQEELRNGNLIVSIDFLSPIPLNPPVPGIVVSSDFGTRIFGSNPRFHNSNYHPHSLRDGTVQVEVRGLPLVSNRYTLSVWLGDWYLDYDEKLDILSFDFDPNTRTGPKPTVGSLEWPAAWRIL